jgi:hypothetical protein
MALDKARLTWFCAPKGQEDSAQGFNPGTLKLNEFARKGREADRMKLAPIAGKI